MHAGPGAVGRSCPRKEAVAAARSPRALSSSAKSLASSWLCSQVSASSNLLRSALKSAIDIWVTLESGRLAKGATTHKLSSSKKSALHRNNLRPSSSSHPYMEKVATSSMPSPIHMGPPSALQFQFVSPVFQIHAWKSRPWPFDSPKRGTPHQRASKRANTLQFHGSGGVPTMAVDGVGGTSCNMAAGASSRMRRSTAADSRG